jgi:hypothetical protein
MNARMLCPGLLGLSLFTLSALAQSPVTGGTPSVPEDVRRAVADLPAGRVARPEAVRTRSAPPPDLEPDVAAVYAFLDELFTRRQVSDATFATARDALGGDRQFVDLIGTIYQMSAMLTAVDRTGLADGEEPALSPLD